MNILESKQEIRVGQEMLRRRYRSGPHALFLFARDLLGLSKLSWDTHGEVCQMFQNAYWGRNQILPRQNLHIYRCLLPRGTFKTSLTTIAGTLWIHCQDDPPGAEWGLDDGWAPNPSFNGKKGYDQRFLLCHETDEKSRDFADAIKRHITKNEQFQELFPGLAPERGMDLKWTVSAFDSPWRQDVISKESTFNTTSLGSTLNSSHYDITFFDDLFSDKQAEKNPEILKNVVSFYQNYVPIADAPGLLWINGTRWHDADLYGYMDREEKGTFVSIEKAIDEDEHGNFQLFFPEEFPQERLDVIKKRMRPYKYNAQYRNKIISEGTSRFLPSYFSETYFDLWTGDELVERLRGMNIFLTCDPAISKKDDACKVAIMVCGWDRDGHLWVLDYVLERGLLTGDLLEKLFGLCKAWNPIQAGIEADGFQSVIKFAADQKSAVEGYWPPWIELHHKNRIKDTRIMALEPIARSRRLHLRRDMVDLEEELCRFPYGVSKDGLDALAYQTDIAFTPNHERHDDENPVFREPRNEVEAVFFNHMRRLRMMVSPEGPGIQNWYGG